MLKQLFINVININTIKCINGENNAMTIENEGMRAMLDPVFPSNMYNTRYTLFQVQKWRSYQYVISRNR